MIFSNIFKAQILKLMMKLIFQFYSTSSLFLGGKPQTPTGTLMYPPAFRGSLNVGLASIGTSLMLYVSANPLPLASGYLYFCLFSMISSSCLSIRWVVEWSGISSYWSAISMAVSTFALVSWILSSSWFCWPKLFEVETESPEEIFKMIKKAKKYWFFFWEIENR